MAIVKNALNILGKKNAPEVVAVRFASAAKMLDSFFLLGSRMRAKPTRRPYTGAELREIRARNGVGRPPKK